MIDGGRPSRELDCVSKPKTLPPVHANVGVRIWYYRELRKMLEDAQYDILLELSLQLVREPVKLAADATPVASLDRTMKRWAKKWTLKFDKFSNTLAERFASKAFGMTDAAMMGGLKKAGFAISFKPTPASRQAYKAVVAENVGLIKNLPSQYVTSVQSAVWQSVNKGADMATLSQKLRENYDIATKRAALISVDQNNKAKAIIENTRRQQLGIKRAIWQHSSAGKEPRPTHIEMDGKEFDLSKGMFDPDANGKGKGEWIWPGQLINCRCTSRAIIPGLEG